jgi:putative tryptophan/tyrosine transport system substrate-binding protein
VIVPYAVRVLNAVRESTRDIPVVFVATSNPVGLGLVESLARPGGNLTGFMVYEVSLAGKLVTILKECAPKISRVALLASSDSLSVTGYWKSMRSAADIEAAIGGFAREPNGGIVLPPDATKITHRDVIIALTVKSRLPTIYSFRADVRRGGLISYGPNHSDLFRRAASYVDRILKGERPSDLPVQAPTTFEMAST